MYNVPGNCRSKFSSMILWFVFLELFLSTYEPTEDTTLFKSYENTVSNTYTYSVQNKKYLHCRSVISRINSFSLSWAASSCKSKIGCKSWLVFISYTTTVRKLVIQKVQVIFNKKLLPGVLLKHVLSLWTNNVL